MSPEEHLAVGRALFRKKWPYAMSTLYGLVPVWTTDVVSMANTPNMCLLINPEWLIKQSKEVVAAALAHEVSHVLRNFFLRVEGMAHPETFNYGSDIAINEDLKRDGWVLGKDWLLAETFKFPLGKTGEEYYDLLLAMKDPPGKKGGKGKGGSGTPDPNAPPGKHDHGIGQGHCRAPGAVGQKADQEFGRTPGDQQRILRQTAEEIKQHVQAKGRGSVPGFFSEWANAMDEPTRVRWQDKLTHLLRNATGRILAGGDDFSIRRPSKRSYCRGLLRPGLIDQQIVPFIALDTSGSMGEKELRVGLRETVSLCQQLGLDEAWFCQVDSAVAAPARLVTMDFFNKVEIKGRGGTDFTPAFQEFDKVRPRPDILIYFTDGDGSVARTKPEGVEVIWAIVPSSYYRKRPAPWGHVITISDDPNQPDIELEPYEG